MKMKYSQSHKRYKPTTAQRTRMMQAVELSNKSNAPSYQMAAGHFRALQHNADEGTHMGHFEYLGNLYRVYGMAS